MGSPESRLSFGLNDKKENLGNNATEALSNLENPEVISEEEFLQLLENYIPLVRQVCLAELRNSPDNDYVSDITQEVMIKALVNRKSLRSKNKMESWLSAITKNACKDYFRKKKVGFNNLAQARQFKVNPRSDNKGDQYFASPEVSVEKQLISNEEFEIILSQLLPLDRDLAIFVYKEGLTNKEIIEKTGYNENTLKVRNLRMRKRIKKILKLRQEIVSKRKKLLKRTHSV